MNAGVYAGCMYTEYPSVILSGGHKLPPQAVVGSGLSYLVGRTSYIFGFTGEPAAQARDPDCCMQAALPPCCIAPT